ncbi:hypothetical protein N9896_00085 [bacterium]|nr:hypothetical protein [bacterium]
MTRNKKINIPLIIALFAVLISFLSVLLSYKETSILEEQQNLLFQQQGASVWPFLENSPVFEIGDSTAIFKYNVTNKGVGPAIIDNVIYTYKNIEITAWGLGLELEKAYPNLSIQQTRNANLSRQVLAPGEFINVVTIRVTVKGNIEGSLIDILIKISEEYKLTYCYCSVYGECWKVDGKDNLTKSSDCKIRSELVN